jgi:hypothetical protein
MIVVKIAKSRIVFFLTCDLLLFRFENKAHNHQSVAATILAMISRHFFGQVSPIIE